MQRYRVTATADDGRSSSGDLEAPSLFAAIFIELETVLQVLAMSSSNTTGREYTLDNIVKLEASIVP